MRKATSDIKKVLSDAKHLKERPSPKRRKRDKAIWYTDNQKLEAVKLWLLTGNQTATAATLGIPLPTLRQWRYSDWWKDLVEEMRQEEQIRLNNRLQKLAVKTLEVMEDRLENGDFVLDKHTGQIIRKEVNLRDSTLAFNSLHDRRQRLLERKEDKRDEKQVVDRLAALAAKFEEIAAKRQPIQVTDVIMMETTDAVHDQRKEGLQEGVILGAQVEAQPGEGQGSQELSPQESGA